MNLRRIIIILYLAYTVLQIKMIVPECHFDNMSVMIDISLLFEPSSGEVSEKGGKCHGRKKKLTE